MELNFNVLILAKDARSYYDAYEVLSDKKRIIQSREGEKDFDGEQPIVEHDMDLSTPALVCLAFSIELHLKLLLRTYDIIATGHNVGKLLNRLPKDEQTCISTHPYFHPTQQEEGFFENIAIASDLFIKTRYYFEKMGTLHFNTGFCITLAKIIRERIIKREPYLAHELGVLSE